MSVLILAEYHDQGISSATRCVVTAAKQIAEDITVLIVGSDAKSISQTASKLSGVKTVLVNEADLYDHGKAETIAKLLVKLAPSYNHIFAASSSYSKNIMPRVAATLDVAHVADILQIHAENIFTRPLYAGNVLVKVKTSDKIVVATIRATAFSETAESEDNRAEVKIINERFEFNRSQFVNENFFKSTRPELASAKIIISGGRGFKTKENFEALLLPLADKLGAAIGATRAVVDAGFISNDYQVGQTGKMVSPELYIAIGISGQIQHLAGMKDSKIIVAINTDAESPMMKFADYALKEDLFSAIPKLMKLL